MTLRTLLAPLLVAATLAAPLSAVAQRRPAPRTAPAPRPATPRAGVTPTLFDNPALAQRYAATITPEDLAAHLYFYASDALEGRETGTRGQHIGALYIATQYRRLGLTPMGNAPGTDMRAPERYFQPFTVYGQRLVRAALTATRDGQAVATATFGAGQQNRDMMPAFASAAGASGGVVFGGYGIADSTLGYNDLAALRQAGVALQGKWVLMLADEPMRDASTSLLRTADGKPSRWTTSATDKIRALIPSGVAGVLVVGDQSLRTTTPFADRVAAASMASASAIGNLSLNRPAEGAPARRGFPPVYTVSSAFANALLSGTGQTVEALKAQIDGSLRPVVMDVPGVTLDNTYERRVFEAQTENVAAMLEGSDPVLKNEVVVVSAHLDHIGLSPSNPTDQINNGADDDGSGTVAVIEMAEAFARAKADGHGPRRSILFLNVTGEEKGLLGSAYFADVNPLVPLASIVTNLNIDMIGRFDPTEPNRSQNYVYIIGSNLISQELDQINTRANVAIGSNVELSQRFNTREDPNQFYRRSDHWNFGKKNIPFVFYFTGTHEDYHGVGDEPQKIEYPRMSRIARLVFGTAWQVANQTARPAVSGTGFN